MLGEARTDVFSGSLPLRTLTYIHVLDDAPFGLSLLAVSFFCSGLLACVSEAVVKVRLFIKTP